MSVSSAAKAKGPEGVNVVLGGKWHRDKKARSKMADLITPRRSMELFWHVRFGLGDTWNSKALYQPLTIGTSYKSFTVHKAQRMTEDVPDERQLLLGRALPRQLRTKGSKAPSGPATGLRSGYTRGISISCPLLNTGISRAAFPGEQNRRAWSDGSKRM